MPTYEFSFPASAAGLPVSITSGGVEVDTATAGTAVTPWGAIVVSADLPDGSYVAEASNPRIYYSSRATGVVNMLASVAADIGDPGTPIGLALNTTIDERAVEVAVPRGGTRVGYLAVDGGPNSYNTSVGNVIYRVPLTLPVTTTRWRLRWRNYNVTASAAIAVANTLTGVHIGYPAYDSSGVPTGNATAALTACNASTATPADGSELVLPWVTTEAAQFTAFEPRLLSVGLIGGTSFNWARCTGSVRYRAGNAATEVDDQTITIAGFTPMYGDWRIEYEFVGSTPVGLHVGDSLTEGQASADTPMSAHPQMFGLAARVAVASCAVSGISLSTIVGWATSHFYWSRFGLGSGWTPDYAVLWLGTNDIAAGRTTAQIKADMTTVIGILRGFGIDRIFVGLVAPRSFAAGLETIRQEVNAWLATNPAGISGTIDFDRALANPADLDSLDLKFDSGDTTHLLARGQARVAEAIPPSIALPVAL